MQLLSPICHYEGVCVQVQVDNQHFACGVLTNEVFSLKGEQGADCAPSHPDTLLPWTTSVTGKARLLTPEELTNMSREQFEKLWAVGALTGSMPCRTLRI